jgi:hypothetical protein
MAQGSHSQLISRPKKWSQTLKYQSKSCMHSGDTEGNFRVKGHLAKVKGHSTTMPPSDTLLSPNTSSLQIQNLHSFRRYRTDGKFKVKHHWARSKVTALRFQRATYLCPQIHHPTRCTTWGDFSLFCLDSMRSTISAKSSQLCGDQVLLSDRPWMSSYIMQFVSWLWTVFWASSDYFPGELKWRLARYSIPAGMVS